MGMQTEPWRDSRYFETKYNRSKVTIWRWEREGVLPAATRINGRKFWPPGTEPKSDGGES